MEPGGFDEEPLAGSEQKDLLEVVEALRPGAERHSRDFAAVAAGFSQDGDRDPIVRRRRHSRISSVKRRFNFIPAAPRMVRMERAVRPCLPITFPRSLGATFSSKTVTCSP